MASGRPDWYSSVAMHGRYVDPPAIDQYITVGVDEVGNMIAVMTGSEAGVPVKVDTDGVMLSRMKGVASGDLVLKILDDCGDTSTITDWAEDDDGLNPADNQVYVKQGSHSMALGIDADLDPHEYANWINTQSQGDLSNYQHDWVYIWVYFPTLDYLKATGTALLYVIGSGIGEYKYWEWTKGDFSVGWNLLKCDLDNPDVFLGVIDWTDIDFQQFVIYELSVNTTDFTFYIDSIMLVRPTPGAGTLKDIAIDENGVLLSKMTGQYADILKPIAIDQNGLMLAVMKGDFSGALKTIAVDTNGIMKANLSAQDLKPLRVMPFYGGADDLEAVGAGTKDDWWYMVEITGQGIVYGGWFYLIGLESHANDKLKVLIDGTFLEGTLWNKLDEWDVKHPTSAPFYMTKYDDVGFEYGFTFQHGITFETEFKVLYYRSVDDVTSSRCRITYAKVT